MPKPIEKYSDTDLGALEEGLHDRPTKDDLKEMDARLTRRVDDSLAMLQHQRETVSDLKLEVRDMKRDRTEDYNALERLKVRHSEFENDTDKRLSSIEFESQKLKWIGIGGFTVATFLGGAAYKVIEFWLSHK